MERQTRVLQQRIEVAPVQRRRVEAQERIGGEKRKRQKAGGDQALDRKHPRTQRHRQVRTQKRYGKPEERQDEHP